MFYKKNMTFSRRRVLQASVASVGLVCLPRVLRAEASNDHVFLLVFLRGGADGMSLVQPEPGPSVARRKYESWRPVQTRVTHGFSLSSRMVMHPALEPLRPLVARRQLCVVPGVGGAQFNRSHFEQQDLVESGASAAGTPLPDGFLGRALSLLPHKDSGLSALALNTTAPYSLRHRERSAVTIPDFSGFGRLASPTHQSNPERTLRARIAELYTHQSRLCAQQTYCETGARAVEALDDFAALKGETQLPGVELAALPQLVKADTTGRLKLLTLDLSGFDTHLSQGNDDSASSVFAGTLSRKLDALAKGLRSLYDAALAAGVWRRITVAVVTEFGRTTLQNGTAGTDHGFGGTALILGSGLSRPLLDVGYFPNSEGAPFYSAAESLNVLPRLVEHRQIFRDILEQRLEVPNVNLVLPDFTPDPSVPRLFA